MDGVKSLLASKTFWGAVVAGLSGLTGVLGHQIDPGDQATIVDAVSAIGAAFGSLLAVYGRIVATKTIG
jgi:hypothetical protein